MNVLAKLQLETCDPCLSEEERDRRQKDFLEKYWNLRQKEENSFLGKMSLKMRQRLHKFVLPMYRIKNRLGGFSYELIRDKRTYTDRPVIFAVTHVGKFDIEVVSEAIRDHYYLLSGDFEHLQGKADAVFLSINGVIYFNETDREDRAAVRGKMISHMKAGGNLMYFPEGIWNLSPNLPVLPCYWGIVEIARKSHAIIVPVAAEQYGKRFKINIGSNFDMDKFGSDASEKTRAINCLRDTLATLKWEIWESEPLAKRANMDDDEWDRFIAERLREWPDFNIDRIADSVYKPKGTVEYTEAFAFMDFLIPRRENAFLFRRHGFENMRDRRGK